MQTALKTSVQNDLHLHLYQEAISFTEHICPPRKWTHVYAVSLALQNSA